MGVGHFSAFLTASVSVGPLLYFAFEPGEVRQRSREVDCDALMLAAGDGLVTRESQDASPQGFVPLGQTFFLCENHGRLLANRFFQNNLLNFLLSP